METNLKITIDHLKNYLGTGFKMKLENFPLGDHERILELDCGHDFNLYLQNNWVKPICYRLSDLDKFIPELGFVPIEWFENHESIDFANGNIWVLRMFKDGSNKIPELIPFGVYQKLFQWHFWPFGEEYFEQGLVIDKLKQ